MDIYKLNILLDYGDSCPENTHFKCVTSGGCVPTSYLCDGIIDCSDKSDEAEELCAPPSPHCGNG